MVILMKNCVMLPLLLIWFIKQEALLSQRGRAMLRVCIASMQNVERSLLLLVVSASDIPLRTINFFSVRFFSAYWSMLEAVTNKHSLVRRRLCDLHCVVVSNCFCHFVVRTSSNRSIANGAYSRLCHYTASSSVNVFWHFARPAIFHRQLLDQNRDLCLYPTCIRRPVGVPVGISPSRLVSKN